MKFYVEKYKILKYIYISREWKISPLKQENL